VVLSGLHWLGIRGAVDKSERGVLSWCCTVQAAATSHPLIFAADCYTPFSRTAHHASDRRAASSRDAGLHRSWPVTYPTAQTLILHVDYRIWTALQEWVYQ